MQKIYLSIALLLTAFAAQAQAPANDDCAGATAVPYAANAAACTSTLVTTTGATQSANANSCSATWYDDDVWYTFTTPAVLPDTVVIKGTPGTLVNWGMSVYASCTATSDIACFSGSTGGPNGLNIYLRKSLLTPNTAYKLRVWGAMTGPAAQGNMNICVYGAFLPAGPVARFDKPFLPIFIDIGSSGMNSDTLYNDGGATLTVASVSSSSALFTTSLVAGASVSSLGKLPFTVTYSATDGIDRYATITIFTNSGTKTFKVRGWGYNPTTTIYEDMEAGVPASFTVIDNDGDGNNFRAYNFAPYSGTGCLSSASWQGSPLTPDNYLVLPKMTPRAGANTFSYLVAAQSPGFPAENYEITVSTTDDMATSFTTPVFTEIPSDTAWQNRTVDLSAFNNQTIYVAVHHFNVTDQFIIKFDDFRFPTYLFVATDKQNANQMQLKAMPNPNNGSFNLTWADAKDVTIQVTDAQGKIVWAQKTTNTNSATISLPDAPSGVYMARLTSAEGTQTTKITIVK